MKSIRTLAFIITTIFILVAGWFFFPAEGITVYGHTLRFPSLAEDSKPAEAAVDVDDVLNKVTKSFEMTCSDNLLTACVSSANTSRRTPTVSICPTTTIPTSTPSSASLRKPKTKVRPTV